MMRTLIYIPEEDYKAIELVAKITHKPKAKIIRKYIKAGIDSDKAHLNGAAALLRLTKLKLHSGDPRFSQNIDKILYE